MRFASFEANRPTRLETPPLTEAPPTFDWRELRRWNIAESQLPPGSTVRFREPTVWEKYTREIVAAGAFILLLVLLVGTLVVNQIRRRRAERLLRESEARFRLFADTAPVMIWMSGPDRQCTDVNRPWLEFTGRTLAAELGNGWAQGVHPADRDRCISTYVNAFDRRQRFEMDYRLRRADGAYRWILDCGAPRFLPDGSFVGYIGSAVDITDQKLAKSMLTDFNHKLIEAQELERARIARELHDDLGQRVAGVTMLLYSLTSGRGKERDTTRATLTQSCGQLAEVTEAMTSISTRLHPPFLDLLGLSGAAAVLCKETSEQHGVQVDFMHENVPSDLPQDIALGLFRVLQEALANAVKHSGAQHVDVVLRGHGSGIQLDVIDRGVGFDPTVTSERRRPGFVQHAGKTESHQGRARHRISAWFRDPDQSGCATERSAFSRGRRDPRGRLKSQPSASHTSPFAEWDADAHRRALVGEFDIEGPGQLTYALPHPLDAYAKRIGHEGVILLSQIITKAMSAILDIEHDVVGCVRQTNRRSRR